MAQLARQYATLNAAHTELVVNTYDNYTSLVDKKDAVDGDYASAGGGRENVRVHGAGLNVYVF
jgi:hypothetical protein